MKLATALAAGALAAALAGLSAHGQQQHRQQSRPLCGDGPVPHALGGRSWQLWGCGDETTLVVAAEPGTPAAPYVFSLSLVDGAYLVNGRGEGDAAAAQAARAELEAMSPAAIAALIAETKKAAPPGRPQMQVPGSAVTASYERPVAIVPDAGVAARGDGDKLDISPSGERVLFFRCTDSRCKVQNLVVVDARGAEIATAAPPPRESWRKPTFVGEDQIAVYEPQGMNDGDGAAHVLRIQPDHTMTEVDRIPALARSDFTAILLDGEVVTLAADSRNKRVVGVNRNREERFLVAPFTYVTARRVMAGNGIVGLSAWAANNQLPETARDLDPHVRLVGGQGDTLNMAQGFNVRMLTDDGVWLDAVATFGPDAEARIARIGQRFEEILGAPVTTEIPKGMAGLGRYSQRDEVAAVFPTPRFKKGFAPLPALIRDVAPNGDLLVFRDGPMYIVPRDGERLWLVSLPFDPAQLQGSTFVAHALDDKGDLAVTSMAGPGENGRRTVWLVRRKAP